MANALQTEIKSEAAPKAVGAYSQAVQAGDFLFVSGQLGLNPQTGKLVEGNVEAQTRQVLNNIEAILKSAGLGFENVVRTEIFLKDMNDFQVVNGLYAERFSTEVKPARQTVQVARLPMDGLIEISCIALKANKSNLKEKTAQ